MLVIMTNYQKEKLSDPEEFDKQEVTRLNTELKVQGSHNRYIACNAEGKIDDLAHHKSYIWMKAKGIKRGNKKKDSAHRTDESYFIIHKNGGSGMGYAFVEMQNPDQAIEYIKPRLSQDVVVIKGVRVPVKVVL